MRDAERQLGRLEAEGQKRWRKQTTQARRDAVRLLRKLEKAIEPAPKKKAPAPKRKTPKAGA
jgi:hypothetical protein